MWNLSISAPRRDIERALEQEIAKYDAVDHYDGQLDTIIPHVKNVIEHSKWTDHDIIKVTSTGGDNPTFGARFTHMLSVTVE